MTINFNDLSEITFDGTVYNEVTKASDNTSATTQEKSNVTYDNFLLHSSKEWLSTIENNASEIVKDVKETSTKVKADKKVVDATKKAAPDSAAFKDSSKKVTEGVKDFAASAAAMTEITNYSGAINFISTTAVNTVTGAINTTADMGISTKSPSISTTTNVSVTNAATSINFSDTDFTKTKERILVSDQELKSLSNKHSAVTNTTSIASKSNKATATEDHQVVASEQNQYSNTHTTLTSESSLFGSKGSTSLITQSDLIIGAGQTNKEDVASGASTDDISNPISDLNTGGSIKILSTGNITTSTPGTIANQADTYGATVAKFGVTSVDTALNSTTTTIQSKTQSTLSSDGTTYTGNRNVGISINPFGILAGTGIAPLIPFLAEQLPAITIDIPELPEFPFGSLADFLAKCLPFANVIDLGTGGLEEGGGDSETNPDGPSEEQSDGPEEDILISLEDPLVIQDKGSIDNPVALEDSSTEAQEPKAVKGVKSTHKDRDVTTTPTTKTDKDTKETVFTNRKAVTNGARLGLLHKVFDPPEGPIDKTTTTVTTSDVSQITPAQSLTESVKSITALQQSEVINFFNTSQRGFIKDNYTDFVKASSIVDVFGKNLQQEITNNSANYSKTVLDILKNKSYIEQINTFLNTLRPKGVGGQQPPNIQDDISSSLSSAIGIGKTPPTPGQGILDVLTALNLANQSPEVISETTEDWFKPESITDSDISFGDELIDNEQISGISELLNNQYVDIIKQAIPDSSIQSALSLTQDIVAGRITTPEQYATRLAALVGGDVSGYISYAQQAMSIYNEVQQGNYSSLLSIPGISNVLSSQGTAIASKVLGLISKKNITDQDIYSVVGSIFTSLTGIGIPLLDELAKLLGCIDSLKQQDPFLQNISNSDLQDIIDYLPRIIQTVDPVKRKEVLNITPSNCGQVFSLTAEEATIDITEIGITYIKFKLSNKNLIKFNNNPLPNIGNYVNIYSEYYTDRITNKVLAPYKLSSQFTSNVLEYRISNKLNDVYTAVINDPSIDLVLEDTISGSLYQYTTNDIGNRLIPYVLDSYILL
jgi:hypothetical protein